MAPYLLVGEGRAEGPSHRSTVAQFGRVPVRKLDRGAADRLQGPHPATIGDPVGGVAVPDARRPRGATPITTGYDR